MKYLIATLLLALPAHAQTLIVGNKGEDSVSFIDYESGEEETRLPTGPAPHEIALSPDGKTAVVVAYGAERLDVYDVPSRRHVKTIAIAPHKNPHGIAFLKDGKRVIATAETTRDVVIVDVGKGEVVEAIKTNQRGSHMLAVTADESRAFVTNLGSRTVSVLDLEKGEKLKDLVSGEGPEGVAISTDGAELWVGNREEDSVTVFDTRTLEMLGKVKTGHFPIRVTISPDNRYAVTSNFMGGSLTVIDRSTRKVAKEIALGEGELRPVTLQFHPGGDKLFVALTGVNSIAEVDLESGQVLRRMQAGAQSDGLAFSPY